MDCGRKMIYFATYENGVKVRPAGYAALFIRGENCDVQMYYRGNICEESGMLQPVYMFRDGTVKLGEEFPMEEGMAAASFQTFQRDFAQSGRSFEELETIYLDGVPRGICGGRPDGRDLEEVAVTAVETVENLNQMPGDDILPENTFPVKESVWEGSAQEEKYLQEEIPTERWSLPLCLENFPELKLPFDGVRRKSCRISLEDMEHLPEQWQGLKDNHFLLHGFYEYHHLLFAKLVCRCGEQYVIGVPGEFCYRNQYMAESFGFFDFAPLEPGKRRGGCFGYWYYYLR